MSPLPLRDTLPEFTTALQQGKGVDCTDQGQWYIENCARGCLRSIGKDKSNRDIRVLRCLQKILNEREQSSLSRETDAQTLKAAKAVIERYGSVKSSKTVREANNLARHALGLEYRLLGGKESSLEKRLPKLIELANKWKGKQIAFERSNLNPQELNQIKSLFRYSALADLVLNDPITRKSFFKWAINNHLDVDIWAQFPNTQKRLSSAYLDKRIGRLAGKALAMTVSGHCKDVTLLFEGKPVSILNETNTVKLANDYTMTVKEAFRAFKNKNNDVGNLEFTDQGITNWHVFKHGAWNPTTKTYNLIDMDKKSWWEQLPLFEKITADQVNERYGFALDPGKHAIAACASRTTPDTNSAATHAWLDILMPTEDGKFQLFPFGKYATHFPATWREYVSISTATERSTLEYPDESHYRTSRELGNHLLPITSEQFHTLMEQIRTDLKDSRNGNFTFQAMGENCAKWVQDRCDQVAGKEIPRFYEIPYYKTGVSGPAAYIFGPIKAIPHIPTKDRLLKGLFRFLGGNKGLYVEKNGEKKFKSMVNSNFWKDNRHHSPPIFIERLKKGLI